LSHKVIELQSWSKAGAHLILVLNLQKGSVANLVK
jgi:hypothetical protein